VSLTGVLYDFQPIVLPVYEPVTYISTQTIQTIVPGLDFVIGCKPGMFTLITIGVCLITSSIYFTKLVTTFKQPAYLLLGKSTIS